MFKKLKDKLAEEVKSSPQRIQQFAHAAQAAVTTASSSISDITNSDLFSIGDNDTQQSRPIKSPPGDQTTSAFKDISLVQSGSLQTSMDSLDFASAQDSTDTQRQRRLSNSSFASDVSFRLPSYESPSMYHLQSDMEVSASEAEERGFGNVSLDRVTKEQIYAAYRRTQERYTKYRTQYADLARHYKLLERENAKAKSVLVETQDKALRRISELREQCSLEQSAKAHLEKSMRVDIEEKNLKIETLNTKIKLLQNNVLEQDKGPIAANDNNSNVQLISFDTENNQTSDEAPASETSNLNNKIDKLEKLVTKYKDSLKTTKEKNAQLTTEIQILSGEVETKNKEMDQLRVSSQHLDDANQKLRELNDLNEELQNKINVYDFNKNKDIATLELDLQKAHEEIAQLQSKINIFSKREEEYAISLAENKLSIHKELEGKETEIKSLKDRLTESKHEIQSLDIVLDDCKKNSAKLEDECAKLKNDINDLSTTKARITELESQIQLLTQKCASLETSNTKSNEEYKCLQLQLKQETAEKLAMIDRNTYLEKRNTQLMEENSKKSLQINVLDKELQVFKKETDIGTTEDSPDKADIFKEVEIWKSKCSVLESEIQEEREELEKLQSEIEKLLANDDLIQVHNSQLKSQVDELKSENKLLRENHLLKEENMITFSESTKNKINKLKQIISLTSEEIIALKEMNNDNVTTIRKQLSGILQLQFNLNQKTNKQIQFHKIEIERISEQNNLLKNENFKLKSDKEEFNLVKNKLDEKLRKVTEQYEHSLNDFNAMNNEKQRIIEQLEKSQADYQKLQNDMTHKIHNSDNNGESLKKQNQNLSELLEESKCKCEQLQNIIKSNNDQQVILNQNISEMAEKIEEYKCNIESVQCEKQSLANQIEEANAKCEILQDIINRNNSDQTILKEKINEFEHTVESLKSEKQKIADELNESQAKCEILQDIINRNNNDQTNLKQNVIKLEQINSLHCEEIQDLKKHFDEKINSLNQENTELVKKIKHAEDNQTNIEKLQQRINDLTTENLSLRTQSEEITNSIKNMEIELREVRKSHAEIEIEKDHLNSIIEQLEANEKECSTKNTQTDNNLNNDIETSVHLQSENLSPSKNTDAYNFLAQENDTLKEENKRFQSDVTGLQTYLAKISKENSVLNDKLRELMASSEGTQENLSLADLRNKVQEGKETLDELIRENSLLEEENLELKEQLDSQHYTKQEPDKNHNNGTEIEYITLKEKYTSLLDINSRLENRMLDLEQMNKSVNDSMSQMQQHNEKLRLTNEKLERRLDEALVSLRHLHALQENTELEYLRNILYEYLTGTGAHSVTLAKVLAAVVKFDKTQTDQVLQKEKERQGFLRQLGLL